MRGKHEAASEMAMYCRITPAHAGKTELPVVVHVLHQDHPRACGENLLTKLVFTIAPGSPPRMRGKR